MPAKSKRQQRLMGMVHACQKGGKCASSKISKIADSIKASDATDFAETKHKNLPNKVAKESLTFREYVLEDYTKLFELQSEQEMREVENHLTQMFSDMGLSGVRFTFHGGDERALRREADATPQEISEIFLKFKKMHAPKMMKALEEVGRFKAVIKDYRSQLNVVIDVDNEMRIVTMHRKPPNKFKTKGGAQSHRGDKWGNVQQLKVW